MDNLYLYYQFPPFEWLAYRETGRMILEHRAHRNASFAFALDSPGDIAEVEQMLAKHYPAIFERVKRYRDETMEEVCRKLSPEELETLEQVYPSTPLAYLAEPAFLSLIEKRLICKATMRTTSEGRAILGLIRRLKSSQVGEVTG